MYRQQRHFTGQQVLRQLSLSVIYQACMFTVVEQCLTSPPTQYRLAGRQFYRSEDPANSIKILKERMLQK